MASITVSSLRSAPAYIIIITDDDIARSPKLVLHPQFGHRRPKRHELGSDRTIWSRQGGHIERLVFRQSHCERQMANELTQGSAEHAAKRLAKVTNAVRIMLVLATATCLQGNTSQSSRLPSKLNPGLLLDSVRALDGWTSCSQSRLVIFPGLK